MTVSNHVGYGKKLLIKTQKRQLFSQYSFIKRVPVYYFSLRFLEAPLGFQKVASFVWVAFFCKATAHFLSIKCHSLHNTGRSLQNP